MAHVQGRFALALLLLIGLSSPAVACGIVYGSDWAFLSDDPAGWDSACGDQSLDGTAITLWPAKQGLSKASAIIYVTVSNKDPAGLKAFAKDEQARFKKSSPLSRVSVVPTPAKAGKYSYVLARFNNAPGKREELVAYLEGPTANFVLVLSADSVAEFNAYEPAFLKYVARFVPMTRK